MAARLEWDKESGRWLLLGTWRLGEVEPTGEKEWTPVVSRWPAFVDVRLTPRERMQDAKQEEGS